MKSERKQIQESNLLADKIEALFVKVKNALPILLVTVGVVVVSLLAYGIYSSVTEHASAKAWTAFYFSDTDTSDLNAISTDYGNTTAGLWAKQTTGDAFVSRALEKVYLDRDLSDQFYKQAIDEYKVVAEKASDPFLKERSMYGLAQAHEGLGDREQAISYYRKVAVVPGVNLDFQAEVNKRIAWLESKAGEQFYDWFTQKQNRPMGAVLNPTPPTKQPLPAAPTFDLPQIQPLLPGASDTPAPGSAETTATSVPATSVPSTEVPTAPPVVPVESKPAESKPAAAESPAAENPAVTQPQSVTSDPPKTTEDPK
ncbi:MAG: tetratricopeptide repeat protein [Pirellula sp.]